MILDLKANYGRKVLDSRCPMCHSEKDTTEYVVEYNKEDKKTIFNDEWRKEWGEIKYRLSFISLLGSFIADN